MSNGETQENRRTDVPDIHSVITSFAGQHMATQLMKDPVLKEDMDQYAAGQLSIDELKLNLAEGLKAACSSGGFNGEERPLVTHRRTGQRYKPYSVANDAELTFLAGEICAALEKARNPQHGAAR